MSRRRGEFIRGTGCTQVALQRTHDAEPDGGTRTSSGCPESIANRSAPTASSNRPCMVSAAPRLNATLGAASESPENMARRHHTPASAPSPRCHSRLASANVDAA